MIVFFFFFFFNPFSKQKIRFTGKLERYTKDEAKELVKKMDGIPVINNVTKDTKFLVVGKQRKTRPVTNNMRIAEKYGVTILTEEEFYEIVDLNSTPI